MTLETRGQGTAQCQGNTLTGHAAVFNSPADLGEFAEVIRPGAFARSLASGASVAALYHHDSMALLGTTKSGTLELREDNHGLAFSLELPSTTYARDLAELVKRGDVSGCSFGFTVPDGGDRWEQRSNGKPLRELLAVDLREVTITSVPAYPDTSVALRSMPREPRIIFLDSLWMRTL